MTKEKKEIRTKEEIEYCIKQLEEYILCDKDYSDLKKFDFYGEINTHLTTPEGIRKVLLWVLHKRPNNCHRKGDTS